MMSSYARNTPVKPDSVKFNSESVTFNSESVNFKSETEILIVI